KVWAQIISMSRNLVYRPASGREPQQKEEVKKSRSGLSHLEVNRGGRGRVSDASVSCKRLENRGVAKIPPGPPTTPQLLSLNSRDVKTGSCCNQNCDPSTINPSSLKYR